MVCETNKIDSNLTGASIAEEECLGELPAPILGTAATGSVTFSGVGVADDTVTIGGQVYTLKAAVAAANQVLIGVSATETASNLAAAVNAGAGAGVNYGTGTVANTSVTASPAAGVVTLTAKTVGVAGDTVTLAESGTATVVSGANLTGGVDTVYNAVFYEMEPNSYADFGGTNTMVTRSPIDPSRQNKKGSVTGVDASGGAGEDVTKSNFKRRLQGFFFADAREKDSTQPLNAAAVVVTGVTAGSKQYAAASGLDRFAAGDLVFASGFTSASNNSVKTVTASASGTVTVAETLVNEASPPAKAKLEVVGFQFASGDVSIAVTDGIPSLVSSVKDLTTLGLTVGEWVFLGGDLLAQTFANNEGYARIATIAQNAIRFDDTTFEPAIEAGTGKTIHLYFGTVIRNEKEPALIKRRSYTIERTLGVGPEGFTQAEYLKGAVANQFTLNLPTREKLTADIAYVATDNVLVTGEPSDPRIGGTRVAALGEPAINTSSDLYRFKVAILDPATSQPGALFGYATEGNLAIDNGVTALPALGRQTAFDTAAGNFNVTGSVTAYFSTVKAVQAVRNNADVGLSMIFAAQNAGQIFDVPLVSLGNGRLTVEKDQAIMLPLDTSGAENPNGYTAMYVNFAYLPDAAMPVQ